MPRQQTPPEQGTGRVSEREATWIVRMFRSLRRPIKIRVEEDKTATYDPSTSSGARGAFRRLIGPDAEGLDF